MVENITVYVDTSKASPYGHRALLALEEVGAKYEICGIDLRNKPSWFSEKVNPIGKVPAIAYGGPLVPGDQPSPESAKLAESMVIVEFLANVFPESEILPKDPLLCAKARFFAEVSRGAVPPLFAFARKGESLETLEQELEKLQNLLPDNTKFAVSDDFTIADIAVAPFIARLEVWIDNEIGVFNTTKGKEFAATLDEKFAKFMKYYNNIKARESMKKTFSAETVGQVFLAIFGKL